MASITISPKRFFTSPWTLFAVVFLSIFLFLDGFVGSGFLLFAIAFVGVLTSIAFGVAAENGEDWAAHALAAAAGFWIAGFTVAFTGDWYFVGKGDVLVNPESNEVTVIQKSQTMHLPEGYKTFDIEEQFYVEYDVTNSDGSVTEYEIDANMTWMNFDFVLANVEKFALYDFEEMEDRVLMELHQSGELTTTNAEKRLAEVMAEYGFDMTYFNVKFTPFKIESETNKKVVVN